MVFLGVAGNVLHLVERPPPSAENNEPNRQQRSHHHHHHYHQQEQRPHRVRPGGQNVFMGSFPLPISNMSTQEIEVE